MTQKTTRRQFVQAAAATGAAVGFWGAAAPRQRLFADEQSPNERIRFASIGVGGKGSSDSTDAFKRGQMVAICDVDKNTLGGAANRFKEHEPKQYSDFRVMLEELGDKIDAVTVSTPDHTHAVAAAMAMKMGKHCFCQKPLTHDVYEARYLADLGRKLGLATQMGNQGTAGSGLRKGAAVIASGALGELQEAHIWTNRPVWPQGGDRAEPKSPPDTLNWDVWLGPAPERPYALGYHPFSWRGWWDFGTGALGDMACHTFNMPFMALGLRDPDWIQAETSGHNQDSYPKWSKITFQFPASNDRPAIKVFWYDGGKKPDDALLEGKKMSNSGSLIIGSKGKLYSPGDYGGDFQLMGVDAPDVEFRQSPGHFDEWTNAIKGGPKAVSNFEEYAGPLTETILLGNLAVYAASEPGLGKKIEWDAKTLTPKNAPEVAHIVKREYRNGWSL